MSDNDTDTFSKIFSFPIKQRNLQHGRKSNKSSCVQTPIVPARNIPRSLKSATSTKIPQEDLFKPDFNTSMGTENDQHLLPSLIYDVWQTFYHNKSVYWITWPCFIKQDVDIILTCPGLDIIG